MDIKNNSSQLKVSLSQSILSIQLNRPDKMNSFTFEMYRSLTEIIKEADK